MVGYLLQSLASSGNFPQKLQASPSLFKNGLWLAHVPLNLPSFFPQIFIAIPATANARSTTVINKSFMLKILGKNNNK